jgi:acetate kinase
MSVNLLCINSGSSSLKFALYQLAEAAETSLANGMIERIGLPGSRLRIRTATALDVYHCSPRCCAFRCWKG